MNSIKVYVLWDVNGAESLNLITVQFNNLSFIPTIDPCNHGTFKERHNQTDPTGEIVVEQLEHKYTTLE